MMRILATILAGLTLLVTSCTSTSNQHEPPTVTIAKPEMTTPQQFNPADQNACLAFGGDYHRDGLAGWYNCTIRYSDGGKACSDATDCQGDCRLTEMKDYDFDSTNVVGTCQMTDSPFGCYSSVQNGRMTPFLCVD